MGRQLIKAVTDAARIVRSAKRAGGRLMATERRLRQPTEILTAQPTAQFFGELKFDLGNFREPVTDDNIIESVNALQTSTRDLNLLLTAAPDLKVGELSAAVRVNPLFQQEAEEFKEVLTKEPFNISENLMEELDKTLSVGQVSSVMTALGQGRVTPRLLEVLDKATAKPLENDLVVHHGTENFTREAILNQLNETESLQGQTFKLGRFTSASRNFKIAEDRAKQVAIRTGQGSSLVISIEAPAGTKALDLRSTPQSNRISIEEEVVFPRDTIFEMLGVSRTPDGMIQAMSVRPVSREAVQPRIMKIDTTEKRFSGIETEVVEFGEPVLTEIRESFPSQFKSIFFERGEDEGITRTGSILFPLELSDKAIKSIVNNDQKLLNYAKRNPALVGTSLSGIRDSINEGTFRILSNTELTSKEKITTALGRLGIGVAVAAPLKEKEE